ncbi:three prime repair exonuclease 2 [Pelodytes ibericus]
MATAVKTFVFLDLEATGLNQDLPKITEICLVAVHVSSLENPVTDESGEFQLPRVLDKLCLCVDPEKPLTEVASKITGLSNQNLGDNEKQNFNSPLVRLINEFLARQAQPVCLVAHNGLNYDFPLLKTELIQQEEDFPSSLLCLDSLQVFQMLDRENGTFGYAKGRYTLPHLYRMSYHKDPIDSHYAEGDVLTLIMIFLFKAGRVPETISSKLKKWGEIKPMYGQPPIHND